MTKTEAAEENIRYVEKLNKAKKPTKTVIKKLEKVRLSHYANALERLKLSMANPVYRKVLGTSKIVVRSTMKFVENAKQMLKPALTRIIKRAAPHRESKRSATSQQASGYDVGTATSSTAKGVLMRRIRKLERDRVQCDYQLQDEENEIPEDICKARYCGCFYRVRQDEFEDEFWTPWTAKVNDEPIPLLPTPSRAGQMWEDKTRMLYYPLMPEAEEGWPVVGR